MTASAVSNKAELSDTVVGSSDTAGIARGLTASMRGWRIQRRMMGVELETPAVRSVAEAAAQDTGAACAAP